MKTYIKYIIISLSLILFSITAQGNTAITLNKVDINIDDHEALQRGAKVFFDKCQGCHGLKYIRYIDLANGIGLKETKDKSLIQIIKETLIHSNDSINENNIIESSINKENGMKWFGKVIPDLSLISRYRGDDWIYTYMQSFYKDTSRPWGVNNLIFPDVGMPHILLNLQGLQVLKQDNIKNNVPNELLELIEKGDLSQEEYNNLIKDLVTFLSYVGEPIQSERKTIGYWVLGFLSILTILVFLLKREYWRDINK